MIHLVSSYASIEPNSNLLLFENVIILYCIYNSELDSYKVRLNCNLHNFHYFQKCDIRTSYIVINIIYIQMLKCTFMISFDFEFIHSVSSTKLYRCRCDIISELYKCKSWSSQLSFEISLMVQLKTGLCIIGIISKFFFHNHFRISLRRFNVCSVMYHYVLTPKHRVYVNRLA